VAKRRRKKLDLESLASVFGDLHVPSLSLAPPQLHGHAYRFMIVLPLLSQTGEAVFTELHLQRLHRLLDHRFGGVLASSSIAHPTWYGSYLPKANGDPVKDYHCVMYVYTRQTDAADRFFQNLKTILKTAGFQEQDEILIERAPVWLVEAAPGDS